ncbi:MAG: lysozyme, partial [Stenotrophomonas sp.]
MSAQDNAAALVRKWEGCRLKAYPDPASGGDPWTIGFGATGPGIRRGVVWTQQQADVYTIVVRPYSPEGEAGVAVSKTYATIGADVPPVLVDLFDVQQRSGGVRLYTWGWLQDTIQSADFAGVEIRYVAGTVAAPVWEDMTPVGDSGFHTAAFEAVVPEAGEWTFACRSRNTSGELSAGMRIEHRTLAKNLGQTLDEITAEQAAQQAKIDAAEEAALKAALEAGKALALMGTEYSLEAAYPVDTVVYKDGRMYRAKQPVPVDTPPPNAAFWDDVGTITQAQSGTTSAISQLRVDLDEQGQQFAAAIDQVNSGLASATTTIQAIGGGGNLCPNSFFALDTAGWATGGAPVPFTWERNYLGVSPPGHGIARAHGVAQPNMVLQGYAGPVIGIDPEKWYMASASVGASGTVNAAVLLLFYDAAGAELAGSSVSPRTTKLITALAKWGSLSNYERLNAPATKPPAGAASARILVRPYGTGNASSSVGFTRAMLEECRQDQTAPTAWSASGTEMSASQTLTLDVGGNISGMQSMNDGKRSSFSILANVFRVITGGAAGGMEWQANYIRIYGNGYQLVMGTGFGS